MRSSSPASSITSADVERQYANTKQRIDHNTHQVSLVVGRRRLSDCPALVILEPSSISLQMLTLPIFYAPHFFSFTSLSLLDQNHPADESAADRAGVQGRRRREAKGPHEESHHRQPRKGK
jgi:hypothetical protein